MRKTPSRTALRSGMGLAIIFALVLAIAFLPASAKSKGPEKAKGGLTLEERLGRMHAIHDDVSAKLPKSRGDSPVLDHLASGNPHPGDCRG